ncbi:hypothetical protein GC163_03460 [bacterium]|nr:hypothetical protein [bacterium]
MKAFVFTLAIVLCVALAAEKGWLFFKSDSQQVTAGINRQVVVRDSREMAQKVQEVVHKVERKVEESLDSHTDADHNLPVTDPPLDRSEQTPAE